MVSESEIQPGELAMQCGAHSPVCIKQQSIVLLTIHFRDIKLLS